jgi:hypothetical protein
MVCMHVVMKQVLLWHCSLQPASTLLEVEHAAESAWCYDQYCCRLLVHAQLVCAQLVCGVMYLYTCVGACIVACSAMQCMLDGTVTYSMTGFEAVGRA